MLVAIDTGGTKTLVSSFGRDGKMGASTKFPTPQDPKEYVTALKQVVREQYAHEKVDIIVLALPGIVKDGVALWCRNLKWVDFDVQHELKDMLPGVPIIVDNDANLAGLSETRMIKETPQCSLYVTISTGIGSGVCENGYIDPAMRYSEAGQAVLEYDGKVQQWQDFSAGSTIVKVYKKYARDITSKRTWRQIADRMSRGFLAVIPIIQPDVIIIGGSVGSYFERYGDMLTDIITSKLPPHIPCPPIIQARHPEEAVIYGCYYYGTDYLAQRAHTK